VAEWFDLRGVLAMQRIQPVCLVELFGQAADFAAQVVDSFFLLCLLA
jgi:hypothetical protein